MEKRYARSSRRPDDALRLAPLEVRRDQQWQLGALLQHVELGGDVVRRADRDDDAAHLERVDPARRDLECGIIERRVVSTQPRHDELGDFLTGRQLPQQAVDGDRLGNRCRATCDPRTAAASEQYNY